MTHEAKASASKNNNNKAASISTNVDTLSTNMNNINISNSKNSVLNNTECGKEAEITSNKKVSTSYAQKVEHCNTDASGSRNTDDMAAADDVGRLYSLPNDKLFLDPPPKEDCPICMLPMPHASGACGERRIWHVVER